MYCPNCGKENSDQQKFCRSCGLGLQTISVALDSELSPSTSNRSTDLPLREFNGWQNPLIYGFLMFLLGLIVTFIGKKIFVDQTIADLGTVTALIGAGLIGLKGVLLVAAQSKQLLAAKTLPKPEPAAQPYPRALAGEPPSITENTTKHLDALPEERARDTQPTS